MFDKLLTETLAPHLKLVEKHLAENGSGYLVGDGVSAPLKLWL